MRVGPCEVGRILVDTRSLIDLLFLSTIKELNFGTEDVQRKGMSLVIFNRRTTYLLGTIKLLIMVLIRATHMANFIVRDVLTHYNTILERLLLHKMRVVFFNFHQVLKYPTQKRVQKIQSDQAKNYPL